MVLFLSDIFPTGYMGAEQANIEPGATVAIRRCGPMGQFAIKSAFMCGADRVIAIDRYPERLAIIDPSFIITHRLSLDDTPRGYDMFANKEDGCIKVVLKP